jgi:hypothetical protein
MMGNTCPKHKEVGWRNKLSVNSTLSWFSLHSHACAKTFEFHMWLTIVRLTSWPTAWEKHILWIKGCRLLRIEQSISGIYPITVDLLSQLCTTWDSVKFLHHLSEIPYSSRLRYYLYLLAVYTSHRYRYYLYLLAVYTSRRYRYYLCLLAVYTSLRYRYYLYLPAVYTSHRYMT